MPARSSSSYASPPPPILPSLGGKYAGGRGQHASRRVGDDGVVSSAVKPGSSFLTIRHPDVVQGPTDVHHDIADALRPQPDPVFDDATALATAVDMLKAQSAIGQGLVGPLLFPGTFLATWLLGRHA